MKNSDPKMQRYSKWYFHGAFLCEMLASKDQEDRLRARRIEKRVSPKKMSQKVAFGDGWLDMAVHISQRRSMRKRNG